MKENKLLCVCSSLFLFCDSIGVTPTGAICNGASVTFTATPVNGGTASYQWQVNGINVGSNSSIFTSTTLTNGDVVTCIMTSSLPCATGSPFTSNAITMTVSSSTVSPIITIAYLSPPDSVTLDGEGIGSTGGTFTSFQWKRNGVTIAADTFRYVTIVNNPSVWTVCVTNSAGCSGCSPNFTTSINELDNNIGFTIQPNPSNGIFILEFLTSVPNKKMQVEIFNELGQKVYGSLINNSRSEIDLSQQAKGIYSLKITDENKNSISKKIIIQ